MVLRFSRGRVGSRLFKVRSYGLTFFCLPQDPDISLTGEGASLSRRGPSRRSPSEAGFGGRIRRPKQGRQQLTVFRRLSAACAVGGQGIPESLYASIALQEKRGLPDISAPPDGKRSELRPRLAAWGRNLLRTVVGTVRQEKIHPGIDPRVCRFQGFVRRRRADRGGCLLALVVSLIQVGGFPPYGGCARLRNRSGGSRPTPRLWCGTDARPAG